MRYLKTHSERCIKELALWYFELWLSQHFPFFTVEKNIMLNNVRFHESVRLVHAVKSSCEKVSLKLEFFVI